MSEKQGTAPVRKRNASIHWTVSVVLTSLALLACKHSIECYMGNHRVQSFDYDNPDALCPIADMVLPEGAEDITKRIVSDPEFRNASAHKLGGAVQVPTVVFDAWGPPDVEPHWWEPYAKLHKYLELTFPTVFEKLDVEKVNTYGLVFTWKGSNSTLKPLMLTAHQDVVPVEESTVGDWTHPPFSGFYDGEYVWGRGSVDCKNTMVGLLETLELLIEQDFKPERTIVVAFGYDEEASGNYGALKIGEHLAEKWGKNSFYAILDEGASGLLEQGGRLINMVHTGEKGYLDSVVQLKTRGGHSSNPPKHTSIGIMADLIHLIESNDFDPALVNTNPTLSFLQCLAENTDIDTGLKKDILKAHMDAKANERLVKYLSDNYEYKVTIKTSQAVDIIQGGLKSNALPEQVSILVNHRISVQESVKDVGDHMETLISEIADEYDLGLVHDGEIVKPITKYGYFNYTGTQPLEPAPNTPVNGKVWETFTGTIRGVFETYLIETNQPIISTPGLSTGNTDTKSYWKLTDNIYRWVPNAGVVTMSEDENAGIHSANEHASVDSHLHAVAFFYNYIQVVDKQPDEEESSEVKRFV